MISLYNPTLKDGKIFYPWITAWLVFCVTAMFCLPVAAPRPSLADHICVKICQVLLFRLGFQSRAAAALKYCLRCAATQIICEKDYRSKLTKYSVVLGDKYFWLALTCCNNIWPLAAHLNIGCSSNMTSPAAPVAGVHRANTATLILLLTLGPGGVHRSLQVSASSLWAVLYKVIVLRLVVILRDSPATRPVCRQWRDVSLARHPADHSSPHRFCQ